MSDPEQDLESAAAGRGDPALRAEVVRAGRPKLRLVLVCGAVAALSSALTVVLLRPGSPVATECTSSAPAVHAASSVGPSSAAPAASEPVGKTEVIVAHEESLGGLAIRGGKISYINYPELGQDNGYVKVASADRTRQHGQVRLRGAIDGIVSGDRATCFVDDRAIQCDGGDFGRFDAHGQPTSAVLRGDAIYWLTFKGDAGDGALWVRRNAQDRQLVGGLVGFGRLAVNSGTAYFAMCTGNTYDHCVIESLDLAGGARQVFAASRGDVRALAVDDHDVYWIDHREIRGMNGAAATPWTVADNLQDPRAIAIDKDHVYWTDYAAGTVSRASKSGGEVTLLAAHQKGPTELALDGDHVYWSNSDDGTIRRTETLPIE